MKKYIKLTLEQKQARKVERKERRLMAKYAQKVADQKAQKPVERMHIRIDWYKHRTWGFCPRLTAFITYADKTTERREYGNVTGYGYDKESTIMANLFNDVLAYKLYEVEDYKGVYGMHSYEVYGTRMAAYEGGIGMSCYYPIASFIGGELRKIESIRNSDSYVYEDLGKPVGEVVEKPKSEFGALLGVMKMMEVIADTPEQSIDSQVRILTAGTGLTLPENWNSLSYEERQQRLTKIKEAIA